MGGGRCCLLTALRLCLCAVLLLVAQPADGAGKAGELCVLDAGGAVLGAWSMDEGQGFSVRYTHSVALTPVEDYFVIRDGIIHLDKTVYQDFGAGLPSAPESGQSMDSGNGRIVMSGYDRPLPRFDVRVGRVAGHVLLLPAQGGTREIPLADLAPAGSALTFTFAPCGCGAGPRRP